MAIEKISWIKDNKLNGYDFHVLRNTPSPVLDRHLQVSSDTPNVNDQPVDSLNLGPLPGFGDYHSVRFIPRFANPSLSGDLITANGISVNKVTGEITWGPQGQGSINSFIIDINLYKNVANSPVLVDGDYGTTSLKVHVHGSITSAYLTPAQLTVREGNNNSRFSVFAVFDDLTVGDLTTHPGINWTSSNNNLVAIGQNSGLLSVITSPASNITIDATLPNFLCDVVANSGLLNVEDSWQSTPVAAKLLPKSPGAHLKDSIPNVLLLSDGFESGDDGSFRRYAAQIHRHLRSRSGAAPWGTLFKQSINFWTAFIPSRERAASCKGAYIKFKMMNETNPTKDSNTGLVIRINPTYIDTTTSIEEYIATAEVFLLKKARSVFYDFPGDLNTELIDTAVIPQNGHYNLSTLVEIVGLPIPADSSSAYSSKVAEWANLIDSGLNTNNVIENVFNFWRSMSGWFLMDEKDTALGMTCGNRPRHSTRRSDAAREIGFNEDRMGRDQLNLLLQNLTNGVNGTSLAGLWDQQGNTPSKDFSYVMVLSTVPRKAGTNTYETFTNNLNLEEKKSILVAFSTSNLLHLPTTNRSIDRPNPLKWFLPIDVHSTIAHELAHSFYLTDEYGTFTFPQNPDLSLINSVSNNYNNQLDSDIRNISGPNAGQLNADLIKWRMLRIQNSGVLGLAGLIALNTSPSTNFIVELKEGQGRNFKLNDFVYLRKKGLQAPYALPSPSQTPSPYFSCKFQITAVTSLNNNPDLLTITMVQGETPITDADFGYEDLLISPVNNPQSSDYAELLSKIMHTHINDSQTATFLAGQNSDDKLGNMVQIPSAAQLPTNLKKPKDTSKIVGLFAGGKTYDDGVYHPTGSCIMRSRSEDGTVFPSISDFCPVCGYVLIDKIDPAVHMKYDKKIIANQYPQL